MFTTLIESRPPRRRSPLRRAGTVASVVAHAALLAVALAATGRAVPRPPARPDPTVVFVAPHVPRPIAPPPTTARRSAGGASGALPLAPRPTASGAPSVPVLTPPTLDLPAVSERPPARGDDFARTLGRGTGTGTPGAADGDGAWNSDVVDTPAAPLPGNPPPPYPAALRAAGVEGSVVARFIVDTLGRVEPPSVEIAAGASDPRFASAVRDVLPRLRFRPAAVGGHRVRQRVEQPFTFALVR